MDYRIYHAVNEFAVDFKWLAHATYYFETAGVALYGLAVLVLWLATAPGEERRWKVAALAGGASAAVSLLVNQLIGKFIWHRPRPYESASAGVPPLALARPFVSERSRKRAFGLAFGIYFVDRRVGKFFIAVATLIAAGRVLVGAHYVTDVLASLAVSLVVAYLIVRFARPLLDRGVLLLERITDPVVAPVHNWWQRQSLSAR